MEGRNTAGLNGDMEGRNTAGLNGDMEGRNTAGLNGDMEGRNTAGLNGDMEGRNTAGLQPGLNTFYYFAYGSNLLKERIILENPSASFHSTAMLKDFKLAFGNHKGNPSLRWQGGIATVVESEGDKVWGVVWKMDISSLDSLDIQEGVAGGIYQPIEISVQTPNGELVCRCYKMNKCIYGLTSPQYKQVMCMGAKQNCLPLEYQKMLGELKTNNYSGPIAIMDKLKEAIQKVQDDE